MGRHGFGGRNEDGEKLLEFAGSLDLVVLNTFFRKRESQTVTYESGRHRSQIDFVLVHQSSLKYVMDCKVLPSEIIAPQHRPVVADFSSPQSKPAKTSSRQSLKSTQRSQLLSTGNSVQMRFGKWQVTSSG
ncbi:hypothetical protein WR25_20142 [Diploscapter pachys]|uniref:Endonuclease/exonuclease/phosphatase domain-containing protein n=1 Tax=Diploscapter pachys TaxID=2018661 RepID=A0A2A2KZS9_9BILA|nr:hypothetical protein WR25_20142 [Diploscapter pachys]